MLPGILVSIALVFIASGMAVWHMEAWRQAKATHTAAELRFARKQFRRRMRTAAMLAVLAVLIAVGQLFPPSLLALCYWLGVTLLVLWLALLGVADVLLTRRHYEDLSRDSLVQEARLRAEIDRLKKEAADGKPVPRGDANGSH